MPCYLEAKLRDGAAGTKHRLAVALRRDQLAGHPLADDTIADLPSRFGWLGFPMGALVPMILVRYERRRFVDPAQGTRVALDTSIRAVAANDAFLIAFAPGELEVGVLELKGRENGGSRLLAPVRGLLSPASFSKYAQCLCRVLEPA